MGFVEAHWSDPDNGIWEVRGPRRHFVHSKVMAWVAIDRAVAGVEKYGLAGPLDRWKELRQRIHDEVCQRGFNQAKGAFTQYYGSDQLDASVLMIPLVGFLPPTDERVVSTVEAIERELLVDGFVARYRTPAEGDGMVSGGDGTLSPVDGQVSAVDGHVSAVDGLPGGEGAFLPCTFWLIDDLALIGRVDDAVAIFERLLGLCNDLELYAEEYDPKAGRMVGNYPQAFTHVGLVNSARNLARILKRRP